MRKKIDQVFISEKPPSIYPTPELQIFRVVSILTASLNVHTLKLIHIKDFKIICKNCIFYLISVLTLIGSEVYKRLKRENLGYYLRNVIPALILSEFRKPENDLSFKRYLEIARVTET